MIFHLCCDVDYWLYIIPSNSLVRIPRHEASPENKLFFFVNFSKFRQMTQLSVVFEKKKWVLYTAYI